MCSLDIAGSSKWREIAFGTCVDLILKASRSSKTPSTATETAPRSVSLAVLPENEHTHKKKLTYGCVMW